MASRAAVGSSQGVVFLGVTAAWMAYAGIRAIGSTRPGAAGFTERLPAKTIRFGERYKTMTHPVFLDRSGLSRSRLGRYWHHLALVVLLFFSFGSSAAWAQAKVLTPDYDPPKVVYDFYLDDPQKMGTALYWIRSLINPLQASPYHMDPEMDMDIVVIIHGTEIVTVAKKNEEKYADVVARMRYYHGLGVDFHVCGLAAEDFDYAHEEFQDFITLVPSAFTDLVHYQQQGYAVIRPEVFIRTQSIDSIR